MRKTYYRRHLPHFQPVGYTYFITFRLFGTLPVNVIRRLKKERKNKLEFNASLNNAKAKKDEYKKIEVEYFLKFEKMLDTAATGPVWLNKNDIAEIVKNKIHFYKDRLFDLICYCIMPNHVHLVITPIVGRDLSRPQYLTVKRLMFLIEVAFGVNFNLEG